MTVFLTATSIQQQPITPFQFNVTQLNPLSFTTTVHHQIAQFFFPLITHDNCLRLKKKENISKSKCRLFGDTKNCSQCKTMIYKHTEVDHIIPLKTEYKNPFLMNK